MLFALTRHALVIGLIGGTLAAQEQWHVGFDKDRADQPPSGFTLSSMRQADAGRWFVRRRDDHNGFLVHQADPGASGYSLAIDHRTVPDDLSLSVRLRANAGARGGGVVWRYRDDQNFYSLILDLSRAELAVYRIASGNRVRLDVQDDLELDPMAWHTLKVVHIESTLRVMLGGIRVFEEQDRRYDRRAAPAGRVGVVATGDSEVWFDDLRVEAKQGRR